MFRQGLYSGGIHGGNTLYGGETGASGLNWWNDTFGPYSDNVTDRQMLSYLNGGDVGPVGNPPDPLSGGGTGLPTWFWPVAIAVGVVLIYEKL